MNRVRGIVLPDDKLCYKVIVINTTWYWHKTRHINHWNGIESSEIDLHQHGQFIFGKRDENIQSCKDRLFLMALRKLAEICKK